MRARNPFVTMNDWPPIVPVSEPPTEPAMPSRVRTQAEVRAEPRGVGQPRIEFFVYGLPAPKGSKDYKGRRKNGSAILVESAAEGLAPWVHAVTNLARETGARFAGPVSVALRFCLPRPMSRKPDAPADRKPDVDKLARAVLDALKVAGMIEDDARVVDLHACKILVAPGQTGCRITVSSWS